MAATIREIVVDTRQVITGSVVSADGGRTVVTEVTGTNPWDLPTSATDSS